MVCTGIVMVVPNAEPSSVAQLQKSRLPTPSDAVADAIATRFRTITVSGSQLDGQIWHTLLNCLAPKGPWTAVTAGVRLGVGLKPRDREGDKKYKACEFVHHSCPFSALMESTT